MRRVMDRALALCRCHGVHVKVTGTPLDSHACFCPLCRDSGVGWGYPLDAVKYDEEKVSSVDASTVTNHTSHNVKLYCKDCRDWVADRGDGFIRVSERLLQEDSSEREAVARFLQTIVPPYTPTSHKGQGGRVGVLGGSPTFTGAPYFAGISSLRIGGELLYLLTEQTAAQVIKTYSPELMVKPVYDARVMEEAPEKEKERLVDEVKALIPRFHAAVVGPGLGDSPPVQDAVRRVLMACRDASLPIVIDADGLRVVAAYPDAVQGYPECILTPNFREFTILLDKVLKVKCEDKDEAPQKALELARKMGLTVVVKDRSDIIADGTEPGREVARCDVRGSGKRPGGIGDILSGTLGMLAGWGKGKDRRAVCLAACSVVRRASALAFAEHDRATSAPLVIEKLPAAFSYYTNTPSHL